MASEKEQPQSGLGRADVLVKEGVRQYVQNSKDPALLALYGRFGDAFNGLVDKFMGPINGGAK